MCFTLVFGLIPALWREGEVLGRQKDPGEEGSQQESKPTFQYFLECLTSLDTLWMSDFQYALYHSPHSDLQTCTHLQADI